MSEHTESRETEQQPTEAPTQNEVQESDLEAVSGGTIGCIMPFIPIILLPPTTFPTEPGCGGEGDFVS